MIRFWRSRNARRQVLTSGTFIFLTAIVIHLLNLSSYEFQGEAKLKTKEPTGKTEPTIPSSSKDGSSSDIISKTNTSTFIQTGANGISAAFKEALFNDGSDPNSFKVETNVKMRVDRDEALMYGVFRNYTGYLTIGIPTVQREGISYLEDTLDSLISKTDQKDVRDIVIVVFMTDTNHSIIETRAAQLYEKYKKYVDDGFIQIMHPDHQFYPDFSQLERTFNDSEQRVAWRSKQNIDYAYLMTYSKVLSTYYLQLEDDVLAAKHYFRDIKNFIRLRPAKPRWFCLQFTPLGFIGKLFRSRDLQLLADFLLLFYSEQPGDLLLNYLKRLKTQFKDITKKPSLFQHKGIISSLKDKKQFLVDKQFKDRHAQAVAGKKKFFNTNPEAELFTSLTVYAGNNPVYAYDKTDRYFWSHEPNLNDYFRISFKSAQNISRIYIATGLPTKNTDMLFNAALKIGKFGQKSDGNEEPCGSLELIGSFSHGLFDTKSSNDTMSSLPLKNIGCISIEVTKEQKNWIIIREIAIFQ